MPSQYEINATIQQNRTLYAKINLLNFNFQVVDELSGVVIGNPSFTNDSTSDIRRTCDISIYPTDSSFDIVQGNKIWLDKYIQIYIGIKNIRYLNDLTTDSNAQEIVYTNMGVYLINNPEKTYSATSNTLKIEGLDLMAKLTGKRNGSLEGMTYTIPQGSNVRQAMIALLEESGFTNYVISECPYTVPNDINISSGGYVYDVLALLRDIVPNYQIYFDINGIFRYELMPSGYNEQIRVDDTIWEKSLISYQVNTDFEDLKNVIEVYGKTNDIDNYGVATVSDSTYSVTISTITALSDQLKIGFTVPSFVNSPYLNVNSYGAKPIKDSNGNLIDLRNLLIPASFSYPSDTLYPNSTMTNSFLSGNYFVVRYISSGDYFLFLGHVNPRAYIEESNPDSPFYVNSTTGRIRKVLVGGEYDNIYSDDLAMERAKWELYTRCRLLDTVTLVCVPIFWLDVNWVISITLPNKQGIATTNLYLIKQISTEYGVSGNQTITLMTYYPYYQ